MQEKYLHIPSEPEYEISHEDLLFLGFGEKAYGEGSIYEKGNRPRDRAERLLHDPASEKARRIMFKNVKELDRRLGLLGDDARDFADVLRETIKDIAIDSAKKNLKGDALTEALELIDNLDKKDGQLFLHLDETHKTTVSLSKEILKKNVGKRGQLLTNRQLQLMEFVALTHDLPKLLGGLNAQIDPDHEVIYREIIGKHLKGKNFIASNGEKIVFDPESDNSSDVDFCTGLSGFHEDIWREKTFAEQVNALKIEADPEEDEEIATDRARMLFHFIDIFGNAIGFDRYGILKIKDKDAFAGRFVDLYRRHIKLPIRAEGSSDKSEDWTRAKVFRPGWGLHGVAGLTWTFKELAEGWDIKIDPMLIAEVELGILQVINESLAAADSVIEGQNTAYTLVIKSEDEAEAKVEREILMKELKERREIIYDTRLKLLAEIAK